MRGTCVSSAYEPLRAGVLMRFEAHSDWTHAWAECVSRAMRPALRRKLYGRYQELFHAGAVSPEGFDYARLFEEPCRICSRVDGRRRDLPHGVRDFGIWAG